MAWLSLATKVNARDRSGRLKVVGRAGVGGQCERRRGDEAWRGGSEYTRRQYISTAGMPSAC